MSITKLYEALGELEGQRKIFDDAILHLKRAIAALGNGLTAESQPQPTQVAIAPSGQSYVDDAVRAIHDAGRPLHANEIVKAISEMRGEHIVRPSVESSIIRHIKKSASPRLTKAGKSTYGVPSGQASLTLAS